MPRCRRHRTPKSLATFEAHLRAEAADASRVVQQGLTRSELIASVTSLPKTGHKIPDALKPKVPTS